MLITLTPVDGFATFWAWADRVIQRTCESFAVDFQHKKLALNIWFNAGGLTGLFVRDAQAKKLG